MRYSNVTYPRKNLMISQFARKATRANKAIREENFMRENQALKALRNSVEGII